jgi:hypothetical protein
MDATLELGVGSKGETELAREELLQLINGL